MWFRSTITYQQEIARKLVKDIAKKVFVFEINFRSTIVYIQRYQKRSISRLVGLN